MKMIIAIVQSEDVNHLQKQLTESGFRFTRIKTAGGFLQETNATLIMGVEDTEVDAALQVIRDNCITRRQHVNPVPAVMEPGEFFLPYPIEVEVGGATVFVLDVARFERI